MFWFSVLLIIISSYFILSIITDKQNTKNPAGFLYFLLIAFSQMVFSFEILSLFKLISKNNILIINIAFFVLSACIFKLTKTKFYIPDIKSEIKKIIFALKRDKILGFLAICFVIFIGSQFITAVFFPVTFGDSLVYYLTRCTAWIQNGTINHFITPDTRELVMPVNMEFLYTWVLLFRQNETGCAVFSFLGGIGTMYIIYRLLEEFGYSTRRRLWSVFVFSSFALISVEMYNPTADLLIGGLILGCIYLFLNAVKENNNIVMFFSSLCYALAVGTKTTSVIAIPSVFLVLVIISIVYNKEKARKNILKFCLMFIVNFVLFASYNYVLNMIQFLNPITCSEQMELNRFRGGFKGWLSNVIKYCFAIFDVSGIQYSDYYNGFITNLQSLALALIGVTDRSFTSPYFAKFFYFDSTMSMMNSALGIVGLFAFLPSIIKSIKMYFKKKLLKKDIILSALTISLLFNILIFSRIMVFTKYNMRYMLTFAIIASPIVAYSYIKKNKKFCKILLCFLMFIYLVCIAHVKPVSYINSFVKYKINNNSAAVTDNHFLMANFDEAEIYKYLLENKAENVAVVAEQVISPNYHIEKLRLHNVKVHKLLLENIQDYDLSKYDYFVTNKNYSTSTNIIRYKERINNPQNYINQCIYFDYRQNEILTDREKPAVVTCEIPIEYLINKGFNIVDDIELKNYFILKNNVIKS